MVITHYHLDSVSNSKMDTELYLDKSYALLRFARKTLEQMGKVSLSYNIDDEFRSFFKEKDNNYSTIEWVAECIELDGDTESVRRKGYNNRERLVIYKKKV